MKKQKIDMLVVLVAVLFCAANANAWPHGGVPDGGATASLFALGVAGLAVVRRFCR